MSDGRDADPGSEPTLRLGGGPTGSAGDSDLTAVPEAVPGAAPPAALAGLPTRRVGGADADFTIDGELGRGGQAVVLDARHAGLAGEVALKRLHAPAPRLLEAFIAEARLAAALDHQAIPGALDLAVDQHGQVLFAMRHVPGATWARSIGGDRERDLAILARVADAVAAAHAAGWIHRDLKPTNVMVSAQGGVWVMDWGLALPLDADGVVRAASPEILAAGTPSYLPPEVARADAARIGRPTDVYLLAGLLCHILTGRPPHRAGDVRAAVRDAAEGRIPALPDGPLGALARRGLDPDPARRPADAAAFRAAFALARQEERARDLLAHARALAADAATAARAIAAADAAVALGGAVPEAAAVRSLARLTAAEACLARTEWGAARDWLDPADPAHTDALVRAAGGLAEVARQAESARRLQRAAASAAVAEHRAWQPVYALACDGDHGWRAARGAVEWLGDRLRWRGGDPRLLIAPVPLAGDVRLRFEGRFAEQPADLALFFAADPRLSDDPLRLIESGYQVKVGAYGNTCSLLIRAGARIATRSGAALRADAWHVLSVERRHRRIRVDLDGAMLLEGDDPAPLGGTAWGLLGFGSAGEVRALGAERLAAPAEEDLLDTAERLLAQGRRQGALELLDSLGWAALSDEDAARRERLLALTRRRIRLSGDFARISQRVRAAFPRAQVAEDHDGYRVAIGQEDVTDLAPLAGLPIVTLDLGGNRIRDLEPLRGMTLTTLRLGGNQVEDLAPLAGMPLRNLVIDGNRIEDLAPLADLPLDILHANRNRIRDLAPLARLRLSVLMLEGNPLDELAPLAGMPLSALTFCGAGVRDLAPLAGMPLSHLAVHDLGEADARPLTGLRLQTLEFAACRAPLPPLGGMQLRMLAIERCPLPDPLVLAGLRLQHLSLIGTGVRDLAPFAASRLEALLLREAAVTDLGPLAGQPLGEVALEGAGIADLAPLAGAPLTRLVAVDTRVAALPAGLGARLRTLACHGSPLARAVAPGWPDGPSPAAAGCPQLRMALTQPWDATRIRAAARPVGGRPLAWVGLCCDAPTAHRLAAAAGGRLAAIVPARDLPPVGGVLHDFAARARGPDVHEAHPDCHVWRHDPERGPAPAFPVRHSLHPFLVEWPA